MCSKVAGHNRQKDFFKKILASGRINHSYIFSGISGIGKKLFACELARSILCNNGSFFEDCNCLNCTQVKANNYADLYIYENKELNVETIRNISESSGMTGFLGKWKIYILDGVEKLSTGANIVAGNAFLKTLEEPGENTLFLLITSKYDMILPTIRSRCALVNFSPLTFDEVRQVMVENNYNISDDIIKLSGGSIERGFLINDLKLFSILEYIKSKDYKSFTTYILGVDDLSVIKSVMEFLYPYALEMYKSSGSYIYMQYGEYILEILNRLNYNINIELAKHDFVSKTIEVFSERV